MDHAGTLDLTAEDVTQISWDTAVLEMSATDPADPDSIPCCSDCHFCDFCECR